MRRALLLLLPKEVMLERGGGSALVIVQECRPTLVHDLWADVTCHDIRSSRSAADTVQTSDQRIVVTANFAPGDDCMTILFV